MNTILLHFWHAILIVRRLLCFVETKWLLVRRSRCQNKRSRQFRIIYGYEYYTGLYQVFNIKNYIGTSYLGLLAVVIRHGPDTTREETKKKGKKNPSKDVLTGALSWDRKNPNFWEKGAGE